MHYEEFDPTDYSVVVKLRGKPPRAWKWEIYRACRWGPLESSPVFFEGMAVAAKEEKGPRKLASESETRGVTCGAARDVRWAKSGSGYLSAKPRSINSRITPMNRSPAGPTGQAQ